MAPEISTFLESISSNGGMSLSNSFQVNIKALSPLDQATEGDDIYAGSGSKWFDFLCDEAQLPNVQAATGTLKGRYLGEGQVNYPHTRVFTEFQLGFQCDAQMTPLIYLNNWFGKVYGDSIPKFAAIMPLDKNADKVEHNRNTKVNYPDDYCRDIVITKTEAGPRGGAGRAAIAYVLERAWPYAIDAVPLQFGTAQITKVTAQFYYTRHHVIRSNIKTSAGFTPEQILSAIDT